MGMKKSLIILVILFGLNVFVWQAVCDLNNSQYLEVTFFDIGQGDAIFIETPQRHQILIDGGPTSNILEKLGQEMPFWDRTIDLIILSHPERDHMAGLLDVLKRYKVKNILWTGVKRSTSEFTEWQRLIKEEKANIYIAQAGLSFGGLQVLYPLESLEGEELEDTNNTSIIIKLTFGENSFLFIGDVNKSVERELIENGLVSDIGVLKVGHHGSKTSTADDFIATISPKIAVISLDEDNSYGHPHPETLETLAKYDITVLRTDILGDIKILVDEHSFISTLR